jgi:hypothetical protein
MAGGFQRLIAQVHKHHPELRFQGTSLWGAAEAGYRDNIRASLREVLKPEENDLSKPPKSNTWSISISHAKHFGGWVAVPLPARIGFDVEEGRRISPAVIERMSTEQERKDCPNPAFLWCAKEAYFKALAQDQPQAITQLNISDWECVEADLYSFKAMPHKPGRGWVLSHEPFLFGICLV